MGGPSESHLRMKEEVAAFVAGLKEASLRRAASRFASRVLSLWDVRDASGKRVDVSFRDLIDHAIGKPAARADLQISINRDGELFLTSRQDGMIRMLVPDSGGTN